MISLDKILEGVRSVGICGHVKPDGDAFGSCMGLYLFLKTYYASVQAKVYLEDNYSESFQFVACSDEIIHDYPVQDPHDLFFVLDCSDLMRLGNALQYFHAAARTVIIDHHISNQGFGMINEIQPDASSTSELITLMIGRERITRQIAEPLYMGIAHDTGVFQYSCTSSRTMMIGGWLIDTGIDFSRICDETFFLKSYHQNQILGRALTESILMMDGKLIFAAIRRKDMDFYQVQPKDLQSMWPGLRCISRAADMSGLPAVRCAAVYMMWSTILRLRLKSSWRKRRIRIRKRQRARRRLIHVERNTECV